MDHSTADIELESLQRGPAAGRVTDGKKVPLDKSRLAGLPCVNPGAEADHTYSPRSYDSLFWYKKSG